MESLWYHYGDGDTICFQSRLIDCKLVVKLNYLRYKDRVDCSVFVKARCKNLSIACTKFSLKQKSGKKCNKRGDVLFVNKGAYCGDTGPTVSARKSLKIRFVNIIFLSSYLNLAK